MKRIGTIFLILFSFIAVSARAQVQVQVSHSIQKQLSKAAAMTIQAQSGSNAANAPSSPGNGDQPLTMYRTEAVSYLQDTTNGNWWVYAPILNRATGDSLSYFHFEQFTGGELLYFINADSIGPLSIDTVAPPANADTVAFDTMYNRVMGIRVSPPKDLGSSVKIDSANITFFPESFSSTDELRVEAVQVEDVPFQDGSGPWPVPALLSTPIAQGTIPASEITAGQLNSLTVSFGTGGKTLTTVAEKNEIAICVYVDGPNFPSDTVGYLLEADAQPQLTDLGSASDPYDTDGSAQDIPGPDTGYVPMRTYLQDLDAGNLNISHDGANYVGGGGGFLVDITQVDQTGASTGNAFFGNVAIVTYFHGTALAGVSPTDANEYSLDQNYPNPVSTTSSINYNLAESGPVTLSVYNALGENVETVVNGSVEGAGQHTATFNVGTLPDGMYYYKLQSGEFTATQSLLIAK